MSAAVQRLVQEALKLPRDEQADLIDALIVDRTGDEDWNKAWTEECERREAAVARGEAKMLTREEFKAKLRLP
jgi:hypothetical protein